MDTTLALGLVSALLGSPRPVVARPLGRAERGILAAIAAVVAEGLGSLPALRFHLAAPSGVLGADRVSLALSVRTPAASGRVWIEWPAAALPPEASAPSGGCGAEGLSDLVTTAVVELARTSLARGFWAGASAGDAVVFDGTACVDAGAPSVVGLRVGAFFAPAIFQTDGTIQLTGAFRPVMEGTQGMNTEDQQLATGNVTEVLAAAPVEIVAEIARVTLRGDEVLGLTTGSVLSLGRRVGDTVDLRVGGRPWARGELVAIDGELGVRLTALAR